MDDYSDELLSASPGARSVRPPTSTTDIPYLGATRELRDVLTKQARLLELELEVYARRQKMASITGRLKRHSDRLKIATQLFTGLLAVTVATGLSLLVIDAMRSEQVVVESFDTPAALAEQGLSGKVVAGRVLDALTALQIATHSTAAKRRVSNAWSNDIAVEVPQTGMSVGEIDRLLHARLGHDTHVGGDLVRTQDGRLALTVRGDGFAARTFAGPPETLGHLAQQAGEYIYGSAEPVPFAIYLVQANRLDESIAFAQAAYPTARDADRVDFLNVWGNALQSKGDKAGGIAKLRMALQIAPRTWKVWANLGAFLADGDQEGAYRAGTEMLAEAAKAPASEAMPLRYAVNFDMLQMDWAGVIAAYKQDAASNSGHGTMNRDNEPEIARSQARLHDWPRAEQELIQADPSDDNTKTTRLWIDLSKAMDEGAANRAGEIVDRYVKYSTADIFDPCLAGRAYSGAGRFKEAEAMFATGEAVTVDCRSYRADNIERSGDWPGALVAHAAAVSAAPSVPFAYYDWGLALARHGDLDGATAKFAAAAERGPHWAEPLKAWGDVLAAQGEWKAAVAKYQNASRYAPAWEALQQALSDAKQHQRG